MISCKACCATTRFSRIDTMRQTYFTRGVDGMGEPAGSAANLLSLAARSRADRPLAKAAGASRAARRFYHSRARLTFRCASRTTCRVRQVMRRSTRTTIWTHRPCGASAAHLNTCRASAAHFNTCYVSLSFFSHVTTAGTPRTVTVQELRLVCMFPADEETERAYSAFLARPLRRKS